jgi:hypothetical protein
VAYREKRSVDAPIFEVEVIDGLVRDRQVKVLFIDGDREGLRSWIRTGQLLCRWGEQAPILRDEQNQRRLREDWDEKFDSVIDRALQSVVVATGESGGFMNGWDERPEVFDRLWKRAGLERRAQDTYLAYQDRRGNVHVGWDTLVRFGMAFCRAQPEMVLSLLDGEEREYRARGHLPGESIYHEFMRENAASAAVVREWCGNAEERARLQKEIERLQGLLSQAAADLERAGAESAARRLRHALLGK